MVHTIKGKSSMMNTHCVHCQTNFNTLHCPNCGRDRTHAQHHGSYAPYSSEYGGNYLNDNYNNAGQIGYDASNGTMDIQLGGGLAFDPSDGDIVVDIPGTNIGFDTGW